MSDELYLRLMLAASSCLLATGLILAAVKTPTDERAHKLRLAKHGLTVAVLVMAVLNIMQISVDPDGDMSYLGSCIALGVSYVQAMLFTNVVLVLVSPAEVTLRRMLLQLGAVAAVDAVLVGAYFLLPLGSFFFVYELCIVLYVALLVVYTRWYVRCHRQFVAQISDYYEEEEIDRSLRWVGVLFWAALAVGVLSLLMLLGHRTVDVALTVVIAAFYAFLAASFVNYLLSSRIIMPALSARQSRYEGIPGDTPHPDRLMVWIEQGGYLQTDKAVQDIAAELEMSRAQFHQYFNKVVGEDFRTWRVRKRVEHACELMAEHPEWPMTRIARESGFNDRSYFYKQFQRFAGGSVQQFQQLDHRFTPSKP